SRPCLLERAPAVAEAAALLGRQLRERLARLGHEEQRAVTEVARSARLFEDTALELALERRDDLPGPREGDDGLEVGRALGVGDARELGEELLPVVLVGMLRARVDGRVDAGLAVERVHEEAGVVRDHGGADGVRVAERLLARVL